MFNALLENYPNELVIGGSSYPIYTDFTVWLGLNEAMQDITLTQEEKGYIILGVFKETIPEDYESMIVAVMQFLQGNICHNKRKTEKKNKSRYVFSFTYDQDYIIGGFMECYGIDLLSTSMHWWKFNALLNALNDSCELKKRIYYRSIRLSEIKDKKERMQIQKIQRQIAIPAAELSDEDIASAF